MTCIGASDLQSREFDSLKESGGEKHLLSLFSAIFSIRLICWGINIPGISIFHSEYLLPFLVNTIAQFSPSTWGYFDTVHFNFELSSNNVGISI